MQIESGYSGIEIERVQDGWFVYTTDGAVEEFAGTIPQLWQVVAAIVNEYQYGG